MLIKLREGGIYLLGNGDIRKAHAMIRRDWHDTPRFMLRGVKDSRSGEYDERGWLAGDVSERNRIDGYYVVKEIRP